MATGWVQPGPARWRRRLVVALVIVAVLIGGSIAAVSAILDSSAVHGIQAAVAIVDHSSGRVDSAFYRSDAGGVERMDVYLAVGQDPKVAQSIGCQLVASELALAGLAGRPWVVFAASGEAAAASSQGCPGSSPRPITPVLHSGTSRYGSRGVGPVGTPSERGTV